MKNENNNSGTWLIEKIFFVRSVKKAYYKLSLQVHPDRVPDEEKDIATEKFKVLSTINSILTDKDKKALYDEQGIIDDNDDEGKLSTWLDLWRTFFKPITTEDIDNFQREYVGECFVCLVWKSSLHGDCMNGFFCRIQ